MAIAQAQPLLFDPPAEPLPVIEKVIQEAPVAPARATDPETAQEAALINKRLRSEQRVRVLRALVAAGDTGATDYELSLACGIGRCSAGKRRLELIEVGCAMSTELRRLTDTRATAIVWKATALGQTAVEQIEGGLK